MLRDPKKPNEPVTLPYGKYGCVYQASAFDKVTGWSKFIVMNAPAVSPATNPANDSGVDEYWMDDEQPNEE